MSKGAGGGGRGKASTVSIKGRSMSSLALTTGMRAGSLSYLRGGGKASKSTPVTLTRFARGGLKLTDGRHRVTVARERGQKTIRGVLRTVGPRGGVTSRKVKIIL